MNSFLNKSLLSQSFALIFLLASPAFATGKSPHALGQIPDSGTSAYDVPGASEDDATAPTIHTATIDKPSIAGFGTLDETNGGLPASVWQGSSASAAESLLSQFRTGIASDILRDLIMRLLMTQATPPTGAGDEWFMARVNALTAIGLDDKAGQLLSSVPISMVSDALRAKHAELLLLRGDTDSACKLDSGDTAAPATQSDVSLFWTHLTILCKAHAGKKEEAMVGIDMLGDQGQHDDPFFQEAIRTLNDKTAIIKAMPKDWTILDVALLRLANEQAIIKDRIEAFPPVTLKYIASDNTLDVKLRDKALTRAQLLGILPIKDSNKPPEQSFSRPLSSDVVTLVSALGSGKPAGSGDNAIIARLQVDEGAAIQDTRRVQRLLTLMEPFGYVVPQSVWQKIYTHKARYDGETPPASTVDHLEDAAHAGHKGETLLLAGLIMDGTDADRTIDLALLPVVKALQKVGLEKDARMLAYSAVKMYGR